MRIPASDGACAEKVSNLGRNRSDDRRRNQLNYLVNLLRHYQQERLLLHLLYCSPQRDSCNRRLLYCRVAKIFVWYGKV